MQYNSPKRAGSSAPVQESFPASLNQYYTQNQINAALSSLTILDAFSVFKSEHLLANGYSQKYVDGFWWMIRSLTDIVGNIQMQDLTLEAYNEWRRSMNDRHRPTTIHTNVSRFKVFVEWMHKQNASAIAPEDIKAPKRPQANPIYLTPEDVTRMISACYNVRDRAIIDVLFSCGIRNTECRELRRKDIIGDEVHIQHGAKGMGNRYVRLSSRAKKHLDGYLASRTDRSAYLFVTSTGSKLANSTFRYIIASIGQRAGIDPAKCHPHAARHGCATYLMEGGMHIREIQDYLGHAFVTTTQIYTHPERKRVMAKHAAVFDGRLDDAVALRQQIADLQKRLRATNRGSDMQLATV